MSEVLAAVWVAGVPRPKGSMTHIGQGRMQDTASSRRWRALVCAEVCRDAQRRQVMLPGSLSTVAHPTYAGPVAVRCVFVRADGQGDVDKLARCVLDALTDSRVIADDVQVVKLDCDRVDTLEGRGDGAFVLVVPIVFDSGRAALARVVNAWLW